jgi:hypothetical protein
MAATPATNLTLISSGLADARLLAPKGRPDPAQFLTVLHKTTRWAAQWSRVEFDGAPEFGTRVSMTLPRRGELVSAYTLVVTLPDLYTPQLAAVRAAGGTDFDAPGAFLGPVYGWTNAVGHALVDRIELEIGGAIVDTLDGRLLEILDELGEPLDAVAVKNRMIGRAIGGFGPRTWMGGAGGLTVRIPIPFWFSQRGSLAAALPLDALSADAVRVHVTFRGVEALYYTDARVDARTVGFRAGVDVEGGMWGLQGGRFWMSDAAAAGRVYSMAVGAPAGGVPGRLVEGVGMPARLGIVDAHAIVEYVSLEERESIALRSADLTYRVHEHVAIPVVHTARRGVVSVPLAYANPVSDLFWVAQRPEAAETYNAWFLYTRDLSRVATPQAPLDVCSVPWWPDGSLALTADSRWAVRPAFQECFSEPVEAVELQYGTYERFAHGGGSLFRAVVPAMHHAKSAIHDRYVYAYSFSVGGGADALPTGAANWDKIRSKDLVLTMAGGRKGALPPDMRVYVYVRGWNVFKVFGGRGGMLFGG